MPYTMEDFRREYIKEGLQELTPEEVLTGLSPEQRAALLKGLSPEERLAGLAPEEIERLLNQLKAKRSSRPRKPRRRK